MRSQGEGPIWPPAAPSRNCGSRCGWQYQGPVVPQRNCSGPSVPGGVLARGIGYARALATWTAAGMPTRSHAEVAAIFTTHCQPCEEFGPDTQTCTICGCRVRQSGAVLRNKIKMATERCPKRRSGSLRRSPSRARVGYGKDGPRDEAGLRDRRRVDRPGRQLGCRRGDVGQPREPQ